MDTNIGAPAASFEARLDRLAEVAVRSGLNLQPGQEPVIQAQLEAVPLVRRVTEHAYRVGASLVTTLLADEQAALIRLRHGSDEGMDAAAGWLLDGLATAHERNAAALSITSGDPSLLSGQDPARVGRVARALSAAGKRRLDLITQFRVNWLVLPAASPGWARAVFPGLDEAEAVARLWEAIFAASRIDGPDPLADWAAHYERLAGWAARLNARRYASLHFRGPGTDLRVGLADGHLWKGGAGVARNGVTCNPNIPTEEVFTTPHRDRVDGHVTSSKPLALRGSLVDGIAMRFEAGRAVEVSAREGGEVLARLLDTDEGARRLGEVALVPNSSPIARSGLLFRNTLLDENAACHIAMGSAYTECLVDGSSLGPAEAGGRGANDSLIHVDWMIGSGEMDVDGVAADGRAEPVMRRGEWAWEAGKQG